MKNILLVEPKSPDFNIFSLFKIPRLGLAILGTLADKAGYNVRIIYEEKVALKNDHIKWADVVGISLTTSTAPQGYKIARMVKALDGKDGKRRPVVMGGVHATFEPDEAIREADYVFRGEADDTFVPFLNALGAGKSLETIPGLVWKENEGIRMNDMKTEYTDMTTVPTPDWSLFEGYSITDIGPVMTSRGCPFDCSFCSVTEMLGKKHRRRTVEQVIDELKGIKAKQVFFYDDHFAANKARTRELLTRIREEQGKGAIVTRGFSAQVRSDIAKDPEVLDLMKAVGFNTLFIGFESVNPETLKLFNKGQTIDDIETAVKAIRARRIRIHGMFVFGSDADDASTFDNTLRFAQRNHIETAQFLILTPLPGTRQYREFDLQGRVLTQNWAQYDTFNTVFLPKNMSPYELQKAALRAMRKFYSPLHYLKWIFFREPIVIFFRIYGLVTLSLWKWNNRKVLKNLKKESRDIFVPEAMHACRTAVGVH
ncbi:MAG: B12-binding domain-containing radical SAM protein [Spirochaetia bacterium]